MSEEIGADWEKVRLINEEMDTLEYLREKKIGFVGGPASTKGERLANQVELYSQGALSRIMSVSRGAISNWQSRNTIASYLCARATIETAAALWDFCEQIANYMLKKDYGETQRFIFKRMLGGKILTKGNPDFDGVNILTILARYDKSHPGIGEHYKLLSEFCHPNFAGTYDLFARREIGGDVIFGDEFYNNLEGFSQMMGALTTILDVKASLYKAELAAIVLRKLVFIETP